MDIGLIKDPKPFEHRVGLGPHAVRTLTAKGHRVYIESGAGLEAGFRDSRYTDAGATLVYSQEEVILRSGLLLCVSTPPNSIVQQLQPGQVVVASWHLALASREQLTYLLEHEITTVGYEIIEGDDGRAPVLQAMSEIAGQLAIIVGSGLLLNDFGGKGILVGGAPGVPPAAVAILGAGTLGATAAATAKGIGAHPVVLDRDVRRLRRLQAAVGTDVPTMLATGENLEKALAFADLFLCAVSIPGERTPVLITRDMLQLMRRRAVLMDLSIDQGGCCETSRPTDFSSPTYEVDDIIHFCVPNLPSAASRASTRALSNAILPFVQAVAEHGFDHVVASNRALRRGTYTWAGRCVRANIAEAFGIECHPIES